MQESIFYNKEQIKVIRNYGLLHKTLFKYWVALFAWIFSLIISFFMVSSWYFSSIYLLEKKDDGTISQALSNYQNKVQQVSSVQSLKWILLNWNININDWTIIAEESLLQNDGLTLPRKTNISLEELNKYSQWQDKERFTNDYMREFYQKMIVNPTTYNDSTVENPKLLSLWNSSLKDLFGLECTTTKSKSSFVCSSYVKTFLNRFYLYDLSKSTSEITLYFNALNSNSHYKKSMCDGILMYGNFVTDIDSNLADLFRSCGSDSYNSFVLLRDFLTLNKQFGIGYVETTAYNNRALNEYKLYSLQQLIYRGISTSSDVKPLIQSYIGFMREVLIREEGKQDALFSTFTKSFAYWYNMNVLTPHFKDEKSKISKDDRTSLNAEMLTINYGDSVAGFKGLQEQSLYKYENAASTNQTTTIFEKQSLKDTFIQSYLPANFNLYSVETGENENTLIVNWIDLRTDFEINATLRYENLQLSVVNISINTEKNIVNETLTDFINSSIHASKTKYTLNQALSLIDEYKDFADKPTETVSLCDQIEDAYHGDVLSCDDSVIEIQSNNIGIQVEEPVIYSFSLTDGVLSDVNVSNEILASQLMNYLDLSSVDASSTLHMIKSILGYKIEDTDTWFGLKEYRSISETIQKYLWDRAQIQPENGSIKVLFSAGGTEFSANYDSVNQELNPIAIELKSPKKTIIVQWLKLTLQDDYIQELDNFLQDPISELEKINPALVEKYFKNNNKK